MAETNTTSFETDALNKLDDVLKRVTTERDRWRDILCQVVGERNAEIMYRNTNDYPGKDAR